jgi:DNA-binding GntR family transcriptional regulator
MSMATEAQVEVQEVEGRGDVTGRLRRAITSGRFMPNERLIEVELAASLNTNRANVRTALALLEQEGLVVREPNRGARVRLVSDKEAIEIVEARGALEALAARQAAARATDADRDVLQAMRAEMRSAFETGDLIAFSALNAKLHREIQRIAGNTTVTKLLEGLKSQVVRLQYRAILLPGRAQNSMREHEAIIVAVCANDVEAAGQAMSLHLDSVVEALKRAIEVSKHGPL